VQKGGTAADANAAAPFVSQGIMLWSLGGIAGYSAFGFIADWIGRRLTITFYSLGSVIMGLILYLALPAYEPWYPIVLPIFGFFVFGVFSGHAVYFPELFPTQIRSTGVAFCNGAARIITSFGPLVAGLLVGAFGGSFNRVTAVMSCFALLSIVAMLIGRETPQHTVPEGLAHVRSPVGALTEQGVDYRRPWSRPQVRMRMATPGTRMRRRFMRSLPQQMGLLSKR